MPYVLINSLDDETPSPHTSPILFKNTVKNPPCNLYPIKNILIQPTSNKSFEILTPKPLTHKCLIPIISQYIPFHILNKKYIKKILFPTKALENIYEFERFINFLKNYNEFKSLHLSKINYTKDVFNLLEHKELFPKNSFLLLDAKLTSNNTISLTSNNTNSLTISINYENITTYNYLYEVSKLKLNKHVIKKDNILFETEHSKKEIDLIYLS